MAMARPTLPASVTPTRALALAAPWRRISICSGPSPQPSRIARLPAHFLVRDELARSHRRIFATLPTSSSGGPTHLTEETNVIHVRRARSPDPTRLCDDVTRR